ncbi:MAG: hypothetical protein NUV93_06930 [Firmicutes bacterium]|nr:hypothetical protein [Bacillota bacterium]
MKVRVRLLNGLHVYERLKRRVVEVEADGSTVREILASAGLPRGQACIAVVGDTAVGMDYRPRPGEEVCVYPPNDGG